MSYSAGLLVFETDGPALSLGAHISVNRTQRFLVRFKIC